MAAMNKVTALFLDHLQHSPALEAVEAWVSALQACDEAPEGVKAASFRYMAAIDRELLAFMATVDVAEAATRLQE